MTARKKTFLGLAGIVVLAVLAVLSILPPPRGGVLARFLPGVRLGLDLQGGTQLIYEANMREVPAADQATALEGVRDVIERRVNAFGVAEPLVQLLRGGAPRVLIELPGIQDAEAAIKQIGETPQLDFREEGETVKVKDPEGKEIEVPQWERTELTGRHLKRADVVFHPQTGEPQVSLVFDGEGKRLFAEITKKNVGKRIAIFLDGTPITAPVVQEAITAGEAVITGTFAVQEAKQLATRLNAGALPVPITIATRTTVGPRLGRESLAQSLMAGIIGMIILGIIMVVLYRLPGVVAMVALTLYGILVFAILQTLGATLTVAGIAGFILSLGMAVDANILIFERLKEGLRASYPAGTALTEGFKEAWPSIRDSNISSLITAVLLYSFGSSVVRGFATTLSIGILVSMFTAIVVTRLLLTALTGMRVFSSSRWYARLFLPSLPADRPPFSFLRIARLWLAVSGILAVASIVAIGARGIRPGIDFTGGSLLELRGQGATVPTVRDALTKAGKERITVQDAGSGNVLLRLPPVSTEEHVALREVLRTTFASFEEIRFETVGPTIGRELLRKAILATVFAFVLILGYLAWAFRKATSTISPWAFGTIAVIALAHDLLLMAGGFTLIARAWGASADSLFLTAVLTLLGFSVHDTIVVFNRMKSNLFRLRLPFRDLVDRSVWETLTRSVNTSATTLFVLLAMLFFGGETVRPFVATLSIGIVVGTYSSIFIAAPILVAWQERRFWFFRKRAA
ncbi:MAG: SecD/SecF fusion protein [Parcubacteria group bacterium Gr01-1014_38]|nr:MAG: SecD/SecF fusion protein [Parcubacteria group bacterium Gr01-1014_38]